MKPELTPLSSRQEGRQAAHLRVDQHGGAPLGDRADLAQRHRDHVRGEGHRLGVEIAAGDGAVLVRKDERIVGDRVGLDGQSPRGIARAGRARRPSPAAGSGSCRGPAPCRSRAWLADLAAVEQPARARRRRGSGPGWPRSAEMRGSNGVTLPFNASTDSAPAASAAANTRSPVNRASSAIAVDDLGAVDQRQPFLGPELRAARCRAFSSASPAGRTLAAQASMPPSPISAAIRWASGARSPTRRPSPGTGSPASRRLEQRLRAPRPRAAARPMAAAEADTFRTIISRRRARSSGSPSPQLCERIRLVCSSASRSSGMRVWASRPKPVLTP